MRFMHLHSNFSYFPQLHIYLRFIFYTIDGYTVSDVVMYWRNTPIRGVEDAELPQFTIMGYETNDRKVKS